MTAVRQVFYPRPTVVSRAGIEPCLPIGRYKAI